MCQGGRSKQGWQESMQKNRVKAVLALRPRHEHPVPGKIKHGHMNFPENFNQSQKIAVRGHSNENTELKVRNKESGTKIQIKMSGTKSGTKSPEQKIRN